MIKVIFVLDPNDWHGHATETLWAEPVPGTERKQFTLMNSPFFTTGISHLDIVDTVPTDNDHIVGFRNIVKRSGHSTYMLLVDENEHRFPGYWAMLEKMGCKYESGRIKLSTGKRMLYSVDVPDNVDLNGVLDILDRGNADKVWIYQEGCRYDANRG